MRIAIVYNTFYYVAKFRLPLIEHFLSLGHSVVVIAPSDKFTSEVKLIGAETRLIPPISSIKEVLLNLPRIIRSIRRELDSGGFDVVFPYTIIPNLLVPRLCHSRGIRCYPNVAGLGSLIIGRSYVFGSTVKWFYRGALKKATGVFFQNPDDLAELRLPEDVATVLLPGSGVDVNRFRPRSLSREEFDDGGLTIIFVGRLLEQKGILDFITLAERAINTKNIPDYFKSRLKFVVVGEKSSKERSVNERMRQAVDSGVIEYAGSVHPSKMEKVFLEARFLLLPTLYGEGIPRSVLEASATGLPCIAYDWRGVRQAVDNQVTGWMVPPRDLSALERALHTAITLTFDDYSEMSREARSLMVREFAEGLVIQRYVDLLS